MTKAKPKKLPVGAPNAKAWIEEKAATLKRDECFIPRELAEELNVPVSTITKALAEIPKAKIKRNSRVYIVNPKYHA